MSCILLVTFFFSSIPMNFSKEYSILIVSFILSFLLTPTNTTAYSLTQTDISLLDTLQERIYTLVDSNPLLTSTRVIEIIQDVVSRKDLDERTSIVIQTLIENISTYEKALPTLAYSTQALIEKDFIWNDLRIETIENSTNRYTRYRISYNSNGFRISWIMNIPLWEGSYPLIILNHGYIDPAVYTVWRGLKREQDYLARNWFAVLHTDYRNHWLSDNDPIIEQNYLFRNYFYSQDSINAILAVQSSLLPETQYIDSNRVWMLWHSMWGGVTMHSLIAKSDLIDAAVLYAPVHATERYNFDRRRVEDLTPSQKQERIQKMWELNIENFMPYSATPYVDSITAPVQIYFGTKDSSVPYQRWVDIQEILTQWWVQSELITYEWEKHEFTTQWKSFMEWVVKFYNTSL